MVNNCYFNENTGHHNPSLMKRQMVLTLAALVLTDPQHDVVVSFFSPSMNDIGLCSSDAKSSELRELHNRET
jgi:hypothetical protein